MGLANSRIIFDNPNCSYYPGSVVSGRVEFTLDSLKKVRGIRVEFLGKASTMWYDTESETRDGKSETVNVTRSDSQQLLNQKFYIIGSSQSEMNLNPGNHVYTFSTTLPSQLPSSFESEYGSVRYKVKVVLDLPMAIDDKIKQAFTVLPQINLNNNLKAKEPVKCVVEKSFGCCCWASGRPLTVVINLPHSGYVPGQAIPLTLEIDNHTNVRVDNVYLSLVKSITWKAGIYSKNEDQQVLKVHLNGVGPNSSRTSSQQIIVPEIQLFDLEECKIIRCKYLLKVVGEVSGCHSNLRGELPIFLGNIPFHQTFGPPPFSDPSAPPPAYSGDTFTMPSVPSAPPPAYSGETFTMPMPMPNYPYKA